MVSLVWLFPIMTAIFLSFGIIIGLFTEGFGAFMGISQWTNDLLGIWSLMNSFPANVFTRLPLIAFMAIVFAGEYEWGTWKNITPSTKRHNLIIAKLITIVTIVMIALVVTSIVTVVFQFLSHAIEGINYEPIFSFDIAIETLRSYMIEFILTYISLLILGTFATISAMLTRSVVGSLLLSFGLSMLDLLSIIFFLLLGKLFNAPEIINLYSFTPSYNFDNIRFELFDYVSETRNFLYITAEISLGNSFLLLSGWILLLTLLSIWLFNRQDITT